MGQDHLNEKNKNDLARRGFLSSSWRMLAVFAVGQSTYMGLRFLASRKAEGNWGEIVTAGLVADFPVKTITPFEAERFFLVRLKNSGFLALFTRCTHLACTVSWHEPQQRLCVPVTVQNSSETGLF
jgi:cytochrome b6-f complex iron-sulfur subunit